MLLEPKRGPAVDVPDEFITQQLNAVLAEGMIRLWYYDGSTWEVVTGNVKLHYSSKVEIVAFIDGLYTSVAWTMRESEV